VTPTKNPYLLISKGFLIREGAMQADDSTLQADACLETETEERQRQIKKKIFKPPSLEDVILYCQEKGFDAVLANRAFEHYNIADWHDAHGKKVKNWKQKINTNWLKPENKPKPNKNSSDAFAV